MTSGVNPVTCGTVTFNDGVNPIATNVPLGSPSSDQAATTTSTLAVGANSITAVYVPGACGYVSSTSSVLSQSVRQYLSESPYGIVFGYSTVGNTSSTTAPRIVTLTNNTGAPITIGQIVSTTTSNPSGPVSISPSPDFQIPVSGDGCSLAALPGGSSCMVGVTFTASAGVGSYAGNLNIPSDALNSPNIVTLSGTGIAENISLSPGMLFTSTLVGHTSATKVATLTNSSTNPVGLTISSISTTSEFVIDTTYMSNPANNPCGSTPPYGGASLAPGTSCTVGVDFIPTAPGASSGGSLVIHSNAKNNPAMIPLSGTGTLSVLTLSPGSLSFGVVPNGTTSADKTTTLTNPNTAAGATVTINSIGTSNAVFGIDSTTCGSSLAPSGTCTINVNFSPTATGTVSGTLNISDNAGNGTQKATLYGTGK